MCSDRQGEQRVHTLVDGFIPFIFQLLKEFIEIDREVAKRRTSHPQPPFSRPASASIF